MVAASATQHSLTLVAAHRTPGTSVTRVITLARPRFVLGLSITLSLVSAAHASPRQPVNLAPVSENDDHELVPHQAGEDASLGRSSTGERRNSGPWTVGFGDCEFSGNYDGAPLSRTGECPTQSGNLFLRNRGITSVPADAFANMGAMT